MTPLNDSKLSFGDIALCLSGGGYRAASFHLGTLSMLDELGLTDSAKYFSTASGGTIVAMKYVIEKIAGTSFAKFAEDFRGFMLSCNVVDGAFQRLETSTAPGSGNTLSLIRSASRVYRDQLTGTLTLKDLTDDIAAKQTFHDLIFNATEFRSGNGFRFRAIDNPRLQNAGNRNVRVRDELYPQITLADIVAASSCFPGAFEPIRFPQDFALADRTLADEPFEGVGAALTTVAIMDGGIFDNQGLHGMMLSYRNEPLPFDFVIASDTTQRADELLSYSIDDRKGGIAVKYWLFVVILILFLLLLGSLALAGIVIRDYGAVVWLQTVLFGIVALFALMFSAGILGLIGWGLQKIRRLPISGVDFPIWDYVKNLSIHDLKTLMLGRYFSAKSMTFSVFMKRIRALTMDAALDAIDDDTRNTLLNGRNVFSLIYDLDPKPNRPKLFGQDPDLRPTATMMAISEAAQDAPTTLWTNAQALDNLVACGRITTCFALLRLIWTRWQIAQTNAEKALTPNVPRPTDPASPFFNDYTILKAKWSKLKTDFP